MVQWYPMKGGPETYRSIPIFEAMFQMSLLCNLQDRVYL